MSFLLRTNPNFTHSEILEYYLLTGGNVRYLQQIRHTRTIEENRDNIYHASSFDDFFDNSFNSSKTNIHKIVQLFKDRIGLSIKEILSMTQESSVSAYNAINELVQTDVLTEFKSGKTEKFYVLTDLFCFNYLRKPLFNSQSYRIVNGLSFEIFAILNAKMIMKEIGRGGYLSIERWGSKKSSNRPTC